MRYFLGLALNGVGNTDLSYLGSMLFTRGVSGTR